MWIILVKIENSHFGFGDGMRGDIRVLAAIYSNVFHFYMHTKKWIMILRLLEAVTKNVNEHKIFTLLPSFLIIPISYLLH